MIIFLKNKNYLFYLKNKIIWGVQFFYKKFIAPKSLNEDINRVEFILNILVVSSIFLVLLANLIVLYDSITNNQYKGLSFGVSFFILFLFLLILFFSRKGYIKIASLTLIFFYLIPNTFFIIKWGVDLPTSLLLYVLIIFLSGILLNTKYLVFFTTLISFLIIIISYSQYKNIIIADLFWKSEKIEINDVFFLAVIFNIIAIISWLSNRETEKSLKRARNSEAELKKERDSLEIRVKQRTDELQKIQMEKMSQVYRFAEFGRLSSGLFHDLVNPLTALSLNLEQVKDESGDKVKEAKSYLGQAIKTTKRMEDFVLAIRKQIQKQEINIEFSLTEEVIYCIQIFSYKARKIGVNILFEKEEDIRMCGNSIKFSQLVSNLLSNAIDSYEKKEDEINKEVVIKLWQKLNIVYLVVQDCGVGIEDNFLEKIWDPFFTTKNFEKGTGIGLSAVKHIVEQDFRGKIEVETEINKGAKFKVCFPIKKFKL